MAKRRESGAHRRVQVDRHDQPSADDAAPSEVRSLTPGMATIRQMRAARPFFAYVPIVVLDAERLRRVPISGRAGFIVALVDGRTTVEELLDISAMSAEETLSLLEDLRLRGIIEFR